MTDVATYMERLIPRIARVIAAVHDDGPDELRRALDAARALPAPPGVYPDDAIAVILAAACDPDRSLVDALAWVTAPAARHHLVRCDPARVERAVRHGAAAGPLTPVERDRVVWILHQLGWAPVDIARWLALDPVTVAGIVRRSPAHTPRQKGDAA